MIIYGSHTSWWLSFEANIRQIQVINNRNLCDGTDVFEECQLIQL